ncbi:methylenetetrahydrofolate reductase C-terminal domain-containing protein [Thermodesulfobacteriota bacterium]
MIVGEQKPIEEILSMIEQYKKIMVVGCGTCVAICYAGGEKEVGVLSSMIRLARNQTDNKIEIVERTVLRQCEEEFVREIEGDLDGIEAVVSIACGAGIQFTAEIFDKVPTYPGLNTTFIGYVPEQGVWSENCGSCGNCVLGYTGGICPVARCAKSIFNGPCGGSQDGVCEISHETPCAWHQIYERLKAQGRLENIEKLSLYKDWKTGRDGGPRKIEREDMKK